MNKNTKNIIIKVLTDKDLIESQEIGIENGLEWNSSGKKVAYPSIKLTIFRTIKYIIFDLKDKKMTFRDSEWDSTDIKYEFSSESENNIFLDSVHLLKNYLKYGVKNINYNEPKKLVYESNINDDLITDICIRVDDDEELRELQYMYENKYGGSDDYFKEYYSDEDGEYCFEDITIKPIYLFLNIKELNDVHYIMYVDKEYNITENGVPTDDNFDDTYKKVFTMKKDKLLIKEIIKTQKISNYINYNEPRKLVYENSGNNINEICIKINNKQELSELESLYSDCGFDNTGLYSMYSVELHDLDYIYVFLNFKYSNYTWMDMDFDFNDDEFKNSYKKIFHIKNDYNTIKMILNTKKINFVDYNEPRKLVYESIISNKYKYRIKTKAEAIKEFGHSWREKGDFYFAESMDELLGKELNFDENVFEYEKYLINGRLEMKDEDYIFVEDNTSMKWYVHKYMIKEILNTPKYNEPKQLVYESESMISNKYKYRIKTEEEAEREFGYMWRRKGTYMWVEAMDYLLGKELNFNKNVYDYEDYINNGRLDMFGDDYILVEDITSKKWFVHSYMIKEILNAPKYNEPKQLVYEIKKYNKF